MVEIEFYYEGSMLTFKFERGQIIKEILKKFYSKAKSDDLLEIHCDIKSMIFLYDGKILDEKLSIEQIINLDDKRRNKMSVLVYSTKEKYLKEQKHLIKSEQIICPKCGENALIYFNDYKFKIYGCKNNHSTENILIDKFEETQRIKEPKIFCNICNIKTKKDFQNNEFYFCGICKKNLCPICKNSHNKNNKSHIIVNFDFRNYTCFEHGDTFTSYCQTCQKNICIVCENEHYGKHSAISFRNLLPSKNGLNNRLKEFKDYIDKLQIDIKKIKDMLDYALKNMELYYKIISDVYYSFDIKKRNYTFLNNINGISNENLIIKDIQNIVYEQNIFNKFSKIWNIYDKMKNNIQQNQITISNFNNNNINSNNNFLFYPINSNYIGIYKAIKEINELKGIPLGKLWDIPVKTYFFDNNNPYIWIFSLEGLHCSHYSGGLFYIKGIFPKDYPQHSPEFCFITPFYHINVNPKNPRNCVTESLGHIDSAIFNWWRPETSIKEIIIDIFSFFWGANPDSPYGLYGARLMKENIELFNKRVIYFTKKYADPSLPYKEYNSWDFTLPNELKWKYD